MSTGSIKHNIEIANPADAERFVEALEEAERISEEGMERLTYWNGEYGCWSYRCASGDAAKRLAEYEDVELTPEQIQAQQQEIGDLKQNLKIQEAITMREMGKVTALTAGKDEQAGQIMRMDTCLKKAKQMFKNIEIITSWPETGSERNALVIAADGHRLIDALLGGAEDGN